MSLLGIDLGGTKLALAIFSSEGAMQSREVIPLEDRKGGEVGALIKEQIGKLIREGTTTSNDIRSIGISVPGIYRIKEGTVWAPNIRDWDDYPLLKEVKTITGRVPVTIDSDRACYILGEVWKGNARGCRDAVFLAVGTGIGAGIMVNGEVLRGSHDIAGAIGWMALSRPFKEEYTGCGCFEHHASGEGIAKVAKALLKEQKDYAGELFTDQSKNITARDVFTAYAKGDVISARVIQQGIEFWGMAVANIVSLFNPEKIIFGGGVFGPAVSLIPAIAKEATRWSQPISIKQVSIEASALGGDAGVYGAGFLAQATSTLNNQL